MELIKRKFEKGDFLKYENKPSSFAIFEGVDLMPSYQYTKKLSVAAFYDPSKYCENENGIGWSSRPVLEVAKNGKPCEKTLDTYEEDYFWKICTEAEKQDAIEKLLEYGYIWNQDLLALVDVETGEVVHKIIIPKLEYNGDVIKPMCEEHKELLKDFVISKNTYSYNGGYNNGYGSGHNGYCAHGAYEEYWD